MNLTLGNFTAPVPGIYHFEFSAQKDGSHPYIMIRFQVNGEITLNTNDKVNLVNWNSALYDDENHHTHFTGWLVTKRRIPLNVKVNALRLDVHVADPFLEN